jgi:uracil phosphoribosyltransferase
MKNLHIIQHPLVQDKLGRLRSKTTLTPEFRLLIKELSILLGFEATRDLELTDHPIETPFQPMVAQKIAERPVLISIMRSGNGMLDALLDVLPYCSAGHVGIYRDKFTHNTVEYYFKIPEKTKGKRVLLLDPLLATGDTIIATIDRLKQYEVGSIKIINILALEAGVKRVFHFHPDVEIYTAGCDKEMNEKGYLLPGIGDAGDRLFGTK